MSDGLTTQMVVDWLKPLVTTGALVVPGRIPDMAKRFIGVYLVPGAGLVLEDTFDVVGFQLSCRGGERNLADTEYIANQIDKAILRQGSGFHLGAGDQQLYVEGLGRAGSAPTAGAIPDSNSRWITTATYWMSISTDI